MALGALCFYVIIIKVIIISIKINNNNDNNNHNNIIIIMIITMVNNRFMYCVNDIILTYHKTYPDLWRKMYVETQCAHVPAAHQMI